MSEIETAKLALVEDSKRRATECGAKLQEILSEYNCDLIAQPTITPDGKIVAVVQIVAK